MASRVLRFRITETDYYRLRQAARADALSISTLVRYAVAEWIDCGAERPPRPSPACASPCPTGRVGVPYAGH